MLSLKCMQRILMGSFMVILLSFILASCRTSDETNGDPDSDDESSVRESSEEDLPSLPEESSSESEDDPDEIGPVIYEGTFELPIQGATGYASVEMEVRESHETGSNSLQTIQPGTPFEILEEEGEWWLIGSTDFVGWIESSYALVNLPDIIPSIIYDHINTYESRLVSSGQELPGITGEALYSGSDYNERLGKEEFIMPVLYPMASKIYHAQQLALEDGNALKIYEAFRPNHVQEAIVETLGELAESNPIVREGIDTDPWGMTWFISTGISKHQRGSAIDLSLVKIDSQEMIQVGGYHIVEINEYTEYEMPTPIHELSVASVSLSEPVTSESETAWQSIPPADSMNEAALLLRSYCTLAGLTPLASEWWHFNDLEAFSRAGDRLSTGEYELTETRSIQPVITEDPS